MKRFIIIVLIGVLGLVAFVPVKAQAAQVFCREPLPSPAAPTPRTLPSTSAGARSGGGRARGPAPSHHPAA
jgi:hypothetical protein